MTSHASGSAARGLARGAEESPRGVTRSPGLVTFAAPSSGVDGVSAAGLAAETGTPAASLWRRRIAAAVLVIPALWVVALAALAGVVWLVVVLGDAAVPLGILAVAVLGFVASVSDRAG